MKRWLLATVAAATLSTGAVQAQSLDQAKKLLDVWLAAQVDYNDWPSLSVAVVKGDDVIYSNAFGQANRAGNVDATTDTLYSICSISKTFTSIALMQQRDIGKVALRDPVSKHLDWYEIEQKFPLSDDVSVQGILTHSSGLQREVDVPYWSASAGFPFPDRKSAIDITRDQETLYRAWDRFQYSNLGFTLAGEIVAAVSGEDFHDYMKSEVLDPMGLTNTYSTMPKDKHGKELAIGYGATKRKGDRDEVPFFNAGAIDPAAGFASSANDLATYLSWQLARHSGNGDEVLDHNTLREMHRPHSVIMGWTGAWGLGFGIRKSGDKALIGHGGSCPGYRSQIFIDPESEMGGVAMINAGGTNPGQIVEHMMTLLGPTLKKAGEDDDNPELAFDPADYEGFYSSQPWGDESYVMAWGDKMISASLSADNPNKARATWKHVEGDTFVSVNSKGKEGQQGWFMRDEAGKVTGFKTHSHITAKK